MHIRDKIGGSRGSLLLRIGLAALSALALVWFATLPVPVTRSAEPAADDPARDPVTLTPVEPPRSLLQPQYPVGDSSHAGAAGVAGAPRVAVGRSAAVGAGQVDMKVLVLSADGSETDLAAVKAVLDRIGIPYDTRIATQSGLDRPALSDGAQHGYYYAVILTTGSLAYQPSPGVWASALDSTQWTVLREYEAAFGVRQITSYTLPGFAPEAYGMSYAGGTASAVSAQLTESGRQVFPYLSPDAPISFNGGWVYLGAVVDPTVTTPLLATTEGYAIASITRYADGRENLAVTAQNSPELLHSILLSYGLVNWATRGQFLGERHVNLNVQIDDVMIADAIWDTSALADNTGLTYRITGGDYLGLMGWQGQAQASTPNAGTLRLEMAFNGSGVSGANADDELARTIRANQDAFHWVNHTYSHMDLDAISYTGAQTQLSQNDAVAVNVVQMSRYYRDALVQPSLSGLSNAEFLRAAADFGIRYLLSNASRPGWGNPSPNVGFYSTYQPSILIIPRRVNNLFYNVSTPAEWASEYNCYYGPTGTCAGGGWRYWDHDLSYAEILDKESDMWLRFLLKWDLDPMMFHQPNLRAYSGWRSLLSDLIDATLAKYNQLYRLPIRNQPQHTTGGLMANRMAYNASGARAVLNPCQSIVLSTTAPAVVPVTGVSYGPNTESYGGQVISYIQMAANETVTIPLPGCNGADTPTPTPTAAPSATPTAVSTPTLVPGPKAGIVISPITSTVTARAIFGVQIQVQAGASQPVDAAAAFINFDPSALQQVDASGAPTDRLTPCGPLSDVLYNRGDSTRGQLDYAAGLVLGTPPSGTFCLAQIYFRALSGSGGAGMPLTLNTGSPRKTDAAYRGASVLGWRNDGVVVVSGATLVAPLAGVMEGSTHPAPDPSYVMSITLTLVEAGLTRFEATGFTDSSGVLTIANLPPGDYDLRIKGSHTLSLSKRQVHLIDGSNTVDFSAGGTARLREGDASNNNVIDIADFSLLRASFLKMAGDTGFNPQTDFDRDGTTSIVDFSLLRANFGRTGE